MVIGMALLASEGLGRFDRRAADLFETELFDITDQQLREVVHQTLDETFVVAGALMGSRGAALALARGWLAATGGGSEDRERKRTSGQEQILLTEVITVLRPAPANSIEAAISG